MKQLPENLVIVYCLNDKILDGPVMNFSWGMEESFPLVLYFHEKISLPSMNFQGKTLYRFELNPNVGHIILKCNQSSRL